MLARRRRTVRLVVAHPALAAALAVDVILGAASGLLRIGLGSELILGLPPDSGPHRAYAQASDGFTPLRCLGLLIDAFIVRTVLVPAVIALVGVKSAWPRHRLRRPRSARRFAERAPSSASIPPRQPDPAQHLRS